MLRSEYDEYLRRFNRRDYDGLLEFYAPQFEVRFGGVCLASRDAVKAFYRFLHAHVVESIHVTRYLSDADTVALEAIVRVEATKELTAEALAKEGIAGMFPMSLGTVLEIPQFIHYHLENGKFTRALCALC